MRAKTMLIVLLVLVSVLSGCYANEYEALTQKAAELETEYAALEIQNGELEQQKATLKEEIDELEIENRERYESTLIENQDFGFTAEEYIAVIKDINENPEKIWYDIDYDELIDKLKFVKTKDNFTYIYTCEIFDFEDTGEKCIAEIIASESDIVTEIKFSYYYPDNGQTSDLANTMYFSYTDLFVCAFIFTDLGKTGPDEEFDYYFQGFFNYGLYYEGNAWVYNYISADGSIVTFDILPIGLQE